MASSEAGLAGPSPPPNEAPSELVIDIKVEPPSPEPEAEPQQMEYVEELSVKVDIKQEDQMESVEEPSVMVDIKQEDHKVETVERKRATKRSIVSGNVTGLPGLLIYNEFCLEMSISPDIKEISPEQLAANLQKFFFYVRLKPASVLEQLFEQVCLVIESNQKIRIQKDPRFRKVVRVCQARLESLSGEGNQGLSTPLITEQLSMFCLRKLLFSTELRPDHPRGLFNLTLLYMMVYMCKGTTHWTEMKALLVSMRKSSFVCRKDVSNNLKYITFRREPSYNAVRIFEVPGHPICPFKMVRLYMSKLSTSSGHLWQRPREHPRANETWFYPVASNAITTEWLLNLMERASMTVSYTNMSLVLTPRSVMDATLADPVFAQTIADEVKHIPEPPEYDLSKLETALPGQERVEIRLLNSSEAQVEIRLTEIHWKELFPEWDRTRLESGYQNHVDFMHHLLEVHRSCRGQNCRSLEMEEGGLAPRTMETQANIPINVAQHGIHNSSVLTVVNNNTTIPQNMSGGQNVIVPLSDLLKSLGAGVGLTGGQTAFDTASNQNCASGGLVNTRVSSNTVQQNGAVGKLPLSSQLELIQQLVQNASAIGQPGGTSLVLPAHPPGTPSTSLAQTSAIIGNNIPPLQGTNAFTQGFQSVLPNLQLDQGQSSTQDLVQAASILSAASQSGGSILTPSVGFQQAGANLPVSTLLKLAGGQQRAAGVVPSSLLETLANAAALSAPQNLLQTAGDPTQGIVPSGLSYSQVDGQEGTPNPNALMATELGGLAEGNPSGSTFVLTSQGIIAVPNLQPVQTGISGFGNPGTVVGSVDISMSTSAATPGTPDGMEVPTGLSHDILTTPGPQQGIPDPTAINPELETPGTLDLSMKSPQRSQVGTATEEAPLDLSLNKPDSEANSASEIIPSTLVSRNVGSVDEDGSQPSNIHEPSGALHTAIRLPGASPQGHIPAAVRSPPPPYPGISPSVSAARQSGVQRGYPRFANEPTGDLQEYLKMTSLKRKGTTGKSVRELLDRKRRNNGRNAPNGTPEFGKSIFLHQGLPEVGKYLCLDQEVQETSILSGISERIIPMAIQGGHQPAESPFPSLVSPSGPAESPSPSLVGPSEPHRQSPGVLSGRKSRRKPQQVFKRMVARVGEDTGERTGVA